MLQFEPIPEVRPTVSGARYVEAVDLISVRSNLGLEEDLLTAGNPSHVLVFQLDEWKTLVGLEVHLPQLVEAPAWPQPVAGLGGHRLRWVGEDRSATLHFRVEFARASGLCRVSFPGKKAARHFAVGESLSVGVGEDGRVRELWLRGIGRWRPVDSRTLFPSASDTGR